VVAQKPPSTSAVFGPVAKKTGVQRGKRQSGGECLQVNGGCMCPRRLGKDWARAGW